MPVLRVHESPADLPRDAWNGLLDSAPQPTPFMRHEYLQALHDSGSAVEGTGWQPMFLAAWDDERLLAACPAWLKSHSYGEYVFLCSLPASVQVGQTRPERPEGSRWNTRALIERKRRSSRR